MRAREQIIKSLQKVTGIDDIKLEVPEVEGHGDYSSNVAMQVFNKEQEKFKSPRELAEHIIKTLSKDKELAKSVSKIEVAGPGFINFWLAGTVLASTLEDYSKGEFNTPQGLKGKKYLIEHTSPNTIKTLHIGHVRNNVLGMAMRNLLGAVGVKVSLDSINNDRGIHVMKAVWAYMKYGKGRTPETEKVKPDHFVDKYYVMGAKAAKDPEIKEQMQELLRRWESGDKEIRRTWKKLRDWTFDGFLRTYKRLGSHHDKQWFESDFYEHGRDVVKTGLEKGIFKTLDDGAVLTRLEKYDLPDTIVLRADGTTMYHTQDLYLTQLKRKEFPSDVYIWDISKDQILYLKQLYAMLEQLGIGTPKDYFHLVYGYVNIRGVGKMSSRTGDVISADSVLDDVVARAEKINKDVAEAVGMGAIKYGLLNVSRERDMEFDIEDSLSLDGNSGPYLQYTHARCKSILRESRHTFKDGVFKGVYSNEELGAEEESLLRSFVHYPEVIVRSAQRYAPNLLCNYLYDLAQKYNSFYNSDKIIGASNEDFRLLLTQATANTLKHGLGLLGIMAPEKM